MTGMTPDGVLVIGVLLGMPAGLALGVLIGLVASLAMRMNKKG